MTNREYVHTLNDEDLVVYVRSNPWSTYADERWKQGNIQYNDAIVEWLDMEYKGGD